MKQHLNAGRMTYILYNIIYIYIYFDINKYTVYHISIYIYTPRIQRQWNHWRARCGDVPSREIAGHPRLGPFLVSPHLLDHCPGNPWTFSPSWIDRVSYVYILIYIYIYTWPAWLQCFADFVLLWWSYFVFRFQFQGIWCFVSFMKTLGLKACALSDIQRVLLLFGLHACGNFCCHIFCVEIHAEPSVAFWWIITDLWDLRLAPPSFPRNHQAVWVHERSLFILW